MNWDESMALWRSQEMSPAKRHQLTRLAAAFETERRKRARACRLRDCGEAAAGLIVVTLLSVAGWRLHLELWRLVFAIGCVLIPVGFFVGERVRAQRHRLAPASALVTCLEQEIAELRHQRRLFWHIGVWYLAPLALGAGVFGYAVVQALPASVRTALWEDGATRVWILFFALGAAGLLFWTWVRVRRDTAGKTASRLASLERLRRELESGP